MLCETLLNPARFLWSNKELFVNLKLLAWLKMKFSCSLCFKVPLNHRAPPFHISQSQRLWTQTCPSGWGTDLLYFLTGLFFFFQYWGLNTGPSPWATPLALFLWRVFWARVLRTICPGGLQTTVLLISASWLARITGINHQHLVNWTFLSVVHPSTETNFALPIDFWVVSSLLWHPNIPNSFLTCQPTTGRVVSC
jgi:hypothetical protein